MIKQTIKTSHITSFTIKGFLDIVFHVQLHALNFDRSWCTNVLAIIASTCWYSYVHTIVISYGNWAAPSSSRVTTSLVPGKPFFATIQTFWCVVNSVDDIALCCVWHELFLLKKQRKTINNPHKHWKIRQVSSMYKTILTQLERPSGEIYNIDIHHSSNLLSNTKKHL